MPAYGLRLKLRLLAQLHEPSGHATIDSTFFDRENASRHYCYRTNYCVQTLKATALVDTDTQAVLDVHCTVSRRHDTKTQSSLCLVELITADYETEEVTESVEKIRNRTVYMKWLEERADRSEVCA